MGALEGLSRSVCVVQLRWLRPPVAVDGGERLGAEALSEETVRAFVAERRTLTRSMRSERALVPLLRYLRALGLVPPAAPTRPVSRPSRQLLPGLLAATRTGLSPAGDDELTIGNHLHEVTPVCWTHETPRLGVRK
jgi:hypothetical protein